MRPGTAPPAPPCGRGNHCACAGGGRGGGCDAKRPRAAALPTRERKRGGEKSVEPSGRDRGWGRRAFGARLRSPLPSRERVLVRASFAAARSRGPPPRPPPCASAARSSAGSVPAAAAAGRRAATFFPLRAHLASPGKVPLRLLALPYPSE